MKKYSILIPTRNGAKYLPYAVSSVLSQSYDDCEVIVSVNHSSDNTLELLKQFHDTRLKVVVPPAPLSMTKHWEWLLQQAAGQWLTIIGDDDALMPYFFEEADRILARHPLVKAIQCKGAFYFWPGCESLYGQAAVRFEDSSQERMRSTKMALVKALAGIIDQSEMPRLYTNGLIHSSVINTIFERSNGQFYHDPVPDVYAAVAIAASVGAYLAVDRPLFWVGTSPKSVGMATAQSAQSGANVETKARATEFVAMSANDQLSVSPRVGLPLWKQSISAFFVLSALRNLPWKSPFLRGKWVEYVTYGGLYKRGKSDALQQEYQKQCQMLGLSHSLLALTQSLIKSAAFFLKFMARSGRAFRKLTGRSVKRGIKFYSDDLAKFHEIEIASRDALAIYKHSQESIG